MTRLPRAHLFLRHGPTQLCSRFPPHPSAPNMQQSSCTGVYSNIYQHIVDILLVFSIAFAHFGFFVCWGLYMAPHAANVLLEQSHLKPTHSTDTQHLHMCIKKERPSIGCPWSPTTLNTSHPQSKTNPLKSWECCQHTDAECHFSIIPFFFLPSCWPTSTHWRLLSVVSQQHSQSSKNRKNRELGKGTSPQCWVLWCRGGAG